MIASRLSGWLFLCASVMTISLAQAQRGNQGPADVSAENLQTLHGFKVEVVLKADRDENGSWISMTKDSKGRLLLGGQRGQSLTRLTLKDGKVEKEEVIRLAVSEIMGVLEVGDALYTNASGPNGNGANVFGLFRLRDTDNDGSFEEVKMLREWPRGNGEHGAHALLLAPDKKHIIAVNGNQVVPPPDALESSPLKNYADDRAIPRQEDTFMAGEKPPGGYLVKMDLDGKNPEVLSGGLRNAYDAAISADGEIFAFDSDMEWDWGTPWYRPTRVVHLPSGADTGYRGGSGKYPTYYFDSIPPVVNIGIGSPTGVVFGYGAKFPAKYQKALFIQDWTFGRLMAVHLTPRGASYEATFENFIAPKSLHETRKIPLNLTDMVIGDDGAMYFCIGGRNTQGCLYRVTYSGDESTAPASAHDYDGAPARELRRQIETYHSKKDSLAIGNVWPHLRSNDRFIRYSARIAIENQPVAQWKAQALAETNPQGAMEALLALARVGGADSFAEVVNRLSKFPMRSLNEELQLQKLRVYQVAVSRNGPPSDGLAGMIVAEVDPLYPSHSTQVNNELSQLLLALNGPAALDKTIKLLQSANTVEEQLAYLMYMRQIKTGWTPQLRQEYFSWFNRDRSTRHPDQLTRWFDEAGRVYANGNSFNGFVNRTRNEAVARLSAEESKETELAQILSAYRPPAGRGRGGRGARGNAAASAPAPREFIKEWTLAELEPALPEVSSARNFQRGQEAYVVSQCAVCHAMAGTPAQGGVGPDLTAISSRFRRRDILEALTDPSKVVSEQFADTIILLKNKTVVVGRVTEDSDQRVVLQPDPRNPETTEVSKADIETRKLSATSPMPIGLINVLSRDEILDLIAYMEAGGRSDHPNFAR